MSFITIEDDIASVSSKVSRLSFGEETMATGKSECTGYKSILYQRNQATGGQVKSPRKKTVYGATVLSLPYIIDSWTSKKACQSCSVQAMCLACLSPKDTHFFRVSTDRLFLVVRIELSECALDENKAFYRIIASLPPEQRALLEYHTKFAARKMSVAKLTGRDSKKKVFIEQRIPLPYPCEHKFATKENDPFFMGLSFSLMEILVRRGHMLSLCSILRMAMLVGIWQTVHTWLALMKS